eukprot:CAMPEP_0194215594 /NCGR_PEP_ID=MMETSP0156-20130528/17517_1 /TAXON_ID=33649 /ORGANISM="Thalassionema nitzschioides, Strain L26-B" /LENGTH=282 /DNA_ID=CAMNT_0038944153 /DNA_START=50 /DNA_END=898 /DNA_ORIENTATION=-
MMSYHSLLVTLTVAYYMMNCWGFIAPNHHRTSKKAVLLASPQEGGEAAWYPSEVVENDDGDDDDEEWTPDREKARRKREAARSYFERIKSPKPEKESTTDEKTNKDEPSEKRAVYSEEEEDLILAMGGKTDKTSKREPGYLGDSTLSEIATDYSVPVCYLADVLCSWGVPVPINTHDRLGDLVTGEQAFAILEAIQSLDVADLQSRYSNNNMMIVCDEYGIELRDAFQMAVKEGWSLPFGVQTCLRVEQEDQLVRALGSDFEFDEDEEDDLDSSYLNPASMV